MWSETSVERINEGIKGIKPSAPVIDSVQTLAAMSLILGRSVSRVGGKLRLIGSRTSRYLAIFIGHVTKVGSSEARPKVLGAHGGYRALLREGKSGHTSSRMPAVKNRYGSVAEMGVFEMRATDPPRDESSNVFLAERPEGASGSALRLAFREGNEDVLGREIQALRVSPCFRRAEAHGRRGWITIRSCSSPRCARRRPALRFPITNIRKRTRRGDLRIDELGGYGHITLTRIFSTRRFIKRRVCSER